jgi:hypothetical protein
LRENIFGGFGLNRRSRRIKERERGRRKEGRKEGRKMMMHKDVKYMSATCWSTLRWEWDLKIYACKAVRRLPDPGHWG